MYSFKPVFCVAYPLWVVVRRAALGFKATGHRGNALAVAPQRASADLRSLEVAKNHGAE